MPLKWLLSISSRILGIVYLTGISTLWRLSCIFLFLLDVLTLVWQRSLIRIWVSFCTRKASPKGRLKDLKPSAHAHTSLDAGIGVVTKVRWSFVFEIIKIGDFVSRREGFHVAKLSSLSLINFHAPGVGEFTVGYSWLSFRKRLFTNVVSCYSKVSKQFNILYQRQITCLLHISSRLGVKTMWCGGAQNGMRICCNSSRWASSMGWALEATFTTISEFTNYGMLGRAKWDLMEYLYTVHPCWDRKCFTRSGLHPRYWMCRWIPPVSATKLFMQIMGIYVEPCVCKSSIFLTCAFIRLFLTSSKPRHVSGRSNATTED